MIEVDIQGSVVRTYGEGLFKEQHDPEILPNGNLLVASHNRPQKAIEIDPNEKVIWELRLNAHLKDARSEGFYKANRINPQ